MLLINSAVQIKAVISYAKEVLRPVASLRERLLCELIRIGWCQVLSGTESGTILVWDDSLIKAQLKRPGEFMCHDSMIEFIVLNEDIKEMTTAGADGYIKFWNLDVMSTCSRR